MLRAVFNTFLATAYLAGLALVWLSVRMLTIERTDPMAGLFGLALGISWWGFLAWLGQWGGAGRILTARMPLLSLALITPFQPMAATLLVPLIGEAYRLAAPGGFLAGILDFAILFPTILCFTWIISAFLYVFLREWRLPQRKDCSLSIALVVPACNEEMVIARTIEGLLGQDYANKQIHVVSDGSTDRTVEIARRYEAQGVVVHDLNPNRGKSGALQYVLNRIHTDLFMVVDADTVADPSAVSYMVQQLSNPRIAAVTGNPRVRNVCNLLTAMQAMEYAGIIGLAKRAEQLWGGLYTVSGATACFRAEVLRQVGGWSDQSATEDIEMSWRIQKAGHQLAYEPRALFHIQAPTTLKALYRQRRRWAQGMMEVVRMHGNLLATRNAALIPILVQVLATGLWVTLMLLTVAETLWYAMGGHMGTGLIHCLGQSHLLELLAWTLGLFVAQTVTACTFDSHYESKALRLIPLALLYPIYYWLIVFPCLVMGAAKGVRSGRTGRWERTARTVG